MWCRTHNCRHNGLYSKAVCLIGRTYREPFIQSDGKHPYTLPTTNMAEHACLMKAYKSGQIKTKISAEIERVYFILKKLSAHGLTDINSIDSISVLLLISRHIKIVDNERVKTSEEQVGKEETIE